MNSTIIIPHRIIQRLRGRFQAAIRFGQYLRDNNEFDILIKRIEGADRKENYIIREKIAKKLKQLSTLQATIKQVERNEGWFKHSDLQKIEQLVTQMHTTKGMPEVQWWVRKQKAHLARIL